MASQTKQELLLGHETFAKRILLMVVAVLNGLRVLLDKPKIEEKPQQAEPKEERAPLVLTFPARKLPAIVRDPTKRIAGDTPAFRVLLNAAQRRYMGMLLSLSLKNVMIEFRRCFHASPPAKFRNTNPEPYFKTLEQNIRDCRVVILGHLYYSALGQCHADPSLAVRHRIPTLSSAPPAKVALKSIMGRISKWPYPVPNLST
ncbi:hypothetical protein DSO57_1002879 [Entomophthora muscae]|uniref:Uncharacterized protein n=1 Tax=Entomophthora muscae TaxID=34485 RepID=A0ACC2TWT4_9FUNG|nr:hypothetical protein DSO57_1002879 [Entomophthora muscae]